MVQTRLKIGVSPLKNSAKQRKDWYFTFRSSLKLMKIGISPLKNSAKKRKDWYFTFQNGANQIKDWYSKLGE